MIKQQDVEFRQKLAKLQSLVAIKNAQVLANPIPYLEDMSERCVILLKLLEEVEYALSPHIVFDFAQENSMEPMDLQGEALIRCNKAKQLIRDYKYKK
jgi:hypothetical protein